MSAEAGPAARALDGEEVIPRLEKWIAAVLLGVATVLRCLYIFRFRYDSDEPQHLHTTWGWTQGLLQYRDFFDNHTPLFHILFSPLVAALGERTNILDFMRFAIVPLWFVSLWCVWKIGGALFSRRAGLWAAVLISLLPWWFFCALEYRTDNLWTPLWLGAVATFVCGTLTRRRALVGGLLLGLCFTASMKTSLLAAVLVMAAILAPLVRAGRLDLAAFGRLVSVAWPALAGMLVAPSLLVSFFAAHGALGPFFYGTIKHNIVPGVDARNHPLYLRFIFPVALPFLLWAAAWIARRAPSGALAVRRAGLFLIAGLYYTALYTFWTLLTRQDLLPFYPLFAVLVAAGLLCLPGRRFLPCWAAWVLAGFWILYWPLLLAPPLSSLAAVLGTVGLLCLASHITPPNRASWLLASVGLLEVALLLGGRPLRLDDTQREREIIGEFLRLTKPGEYVLDFKGEAVFRRRAFYYVMEPLTYVRVKSRDIPDTVAEDLVNKKVFVVLNQDRWFDCAKKGVKFMEENYLAVGRTRVAGKVIASPAEAQQLIRFEVAVPARYTFWADGHPITGILDGTPGIQSSELSAGAHEFKPNAAGEHAAIFWSRAADAGFQPILDSPGWQYFR